MSQQLGYFLALQAAADVVLAVVVLYHFPLCPPLVLLLGDLVVDVVAQRGLLKDPSVDDECPRGALYGVALALKPLAEALLLLRMYLEMYVPFRREESQCLVAFPRPVRRRE